MWAVFRIPHTFKQFWKLADVNCELLSQSKLLVLGCLKLKDSQLALLKVTEDVLGLLSW